jgi:hypothetical protein
VAGSACTNVVFGSVHPAAAAAAAPPLGVVGARDEDDDMDTRGGYLKKKQREWQGGVLHMRVWNGMEWRSSLAGSFLRDRKAALKP